MSEEIQLSVIVPTFNRADALQKTLDYLSKQRFKKMWEVIVVNNNCTDDTDEVIRSRQSNFPVPLHLVHEKKPGASAARNAGARTAQGKLLIFVDNDILTEPDFLERHYKMLQENDNSWVIGQVINMPEQENSVFGKYRKQLYPVLSTEETVRETDIITGQNVSLPRKHFILLNGFDENFYVASGEDHEFAMRGRKQLGIKTLLVPNIVVAHNDWAGWTFQDFCLRQRMYARTEFFFWQKYGDEHPRQELVRENLPINWHNDSVKSKARKVAKQILGTELVQAVLLQSCSVLEKIPSLQPLLWRIYKLTLAGAINRGFREGRKSALKKQSADVDSKLAANNPKV